MKLPTALAQMLVTGILVSCLGVATAQQAYPSKPIRFIVPYPPGGGTTPVVRLISQRLAENWGQQVMVDNRGGGNTIIGSEALVNSKPDGYTILLVTSTHTINPNLLSTPYDAIKDFSPVATLVISQFLLVLHPSLPVGNLREFIALAKSKPGQLNYSSSGIGTSNHLAAELFSMAAGVKMQHVSYKGGGPAITDLVGGQVQLSFQAPPAAIPHIQSGRLRAIAISGETRLPALPKVPTFTEAGLPGLDLKIWYGILAPAGTQKEIIDKLSTEIAKIVVMGHVSAFIEHFFNVNVSMSQRSSNGNHGFPVNLRYAR